MPFKVGGPSGGDIKNIFVTEYEVINNMTGHELWNWGQSNFGSLGNNTGADLATNSTVNQSSPVQTVAGGTNWRWVAPGGCITTALRLFNGYDF